MTTHTYAKCTTNNSTNNAGGSIDSEISSNCFKYNATMRFSSIYASYDFIHLFRTNGKSYTRANRFVSLLPQPGVFELTATY